MIRPDYFLSESEFSGMHKINHILHIVNHGTMSTTNYGDKRIVLMCIGVYGIGQSSTEPQSSIGFTYGYLRFTPSVLLICENEETPKGLNVNSHL